ncbi:Aldose 1-/Glucose-6-phosphate 1-epimerase [Corchorus olitorius]|uniref:Aldose 1-/Glucose-6-phosphate 1-epimerase n=1 Tax=Corchorus olitorius TaxID=93759 RepID=A0A1R3HLZ8_9ROSI|nr:Aldose 1-/Glucose-6-phosphate 1-epimerase [Corchorus olitorius]
MRGFGFVSSLSYFKVVINLFKDFVYYIEPWYGTTTKYKNDATCFGVFVGRVANRIGGANFTFNGTENKLKANELMKGKLHGGPKGYGDVIWNVRKYKNNGYQPSIRFSYDSYDGEKENLEMKDVREMSES